MEGKANPDPNLGPSFATAEAARRLEPRLVELAGQLNATHAQLVDIVTEAAITGAWQGAGIRDLAQWVSWKCGIAHRRAKQLVAIAAARDSHPAINAVFADGGASIDQVSVAMQCHQVDDAEFAHFVTVMTVPQLHIALRASQPPDDGDDDAARSSESVEQHHDRNGQWRCDIRLDGDRGELVATALREARDRLFNDGNHDATWADALVDIAQRSIDALPLARRERFRVNMFIDPAADARATWTNGVGIPDAIRDLLLCDGTVNPMYVENGLPVNVGRAQRIVPDRLRRLIEHRDKKCRVPWCNREHGLQIHHLIEWKDGGHTVTWNLIAICECCHRKHHKGELGIVGNADVADGLLFTDHEGHQIDFAAHPEKPSRPAPTAKRPYRHPLGERLQASLLFFHPQRRNPDFCYRGWPPTAKSNADVPGNSDTDPE